MGQPQRRGITRQLPSEDPCPPDNSLKKLFGYNNLTNRQISHFHHVGTRDEINVRHLLAIDSKDFDLLSVGALDDDTAIGDMDADIGGDGITNAGGVTLGEECHEAVVAVNDQRARIIGVAIIPMVKMVAGIRDCLDLNGVQIGVRATPLNSTSLFVLTAHLDAVVANDEIGRNDTVGSDIERIGNLQWSNA